MILSRFLFKHSFVFHVIVVLPKKTTQLGSCQPILSSKDRLRSKLKVARTPIGTPAPVKYQRFASLWFGYKHNIFEICDLSRFTHSLHFQQKNLIFWTWNQPEATMKCTGSRNTQNVLRWMTSDLRGDT